MAKSKVTYTYQGITFSTASKVVAKRAAAGNLKAAYTRYVSDTAGRALRGTEMAKEKRLALVRGVERGAISPEYIKQRVVDYKKEVAHNINENLQDQYKDVFDQLRDSSDPAVRAMADDIQEAIDYWSERYERDAKTSLNQDIRDIINAGMDDVSEEGLQDLLKVDTAATMVMEQDYIREKARKSTLASRKKTRHQEE